MLARSLFSIALSVCWGLGLANSALALPINLSADFSGADYGTSDMTLVNGGGSGAFWVSDPGISSPFGANQRLRLTSNSGGQRGNAWYNPTTIAANADWTLDFTFQITYPGGGGGADGLAFHIQQLGLGADTSILGHELGADFLSVTFDSWNNGDYCSVDWGMAVFNNGSQIGTCVDLSGIGGPDPWAYQVSLVHDDASNALTIDVTNVNSGLSTGNLGYTVNLTALDAANFGWSAQTGGAAENHDIVSFNGVFEIPEPNTILLLGLGLIGLKIQRRRRA